MEQNVEIKQDLKNKLLQLFNRNKFKFFALFSLFFLIIASVVLLKEYDKKNNALIAEKYVQARIYLTNDKKNDAKIIYEEIILSNNKFYSILALNEIIEKNLTTREDEILKYFEILESLDYSKEKLDLIVFKKALYLMKISRNEDGKKLLENLIKNKSKLKILAEEIILN